MKFSARSKISHYMKGKVLITGGAGFIGSHTADLMHQQGYEVRILDNLSPKIHNGELPRYLNKDYEFIKGDVRLKKSWYQALQGVDYVIHLAGKMDLTPDFSDYARVNVAGTANLYEMIVKNRFRVKRVILASSQFVYGQGKWQCKKDGIVYPKERYETDLKKGKWDPVCPICKGKIKYLSNTEDVVDPPNHYAVSKYSSELMGLKLGRIYHIPTVVLRYSITHGSRQSIKNLYSGALRQFVLWILAGKNIEIYEDGEQLRDYISVKDVANANLVVLQSKNSDFETFNVAGDEVYKIKDLAKLVRKVMNKKTRILKKGLYRPGDIRNAVSDNSKLKSLGWRPQFNEEGSIRDFIKWIKSVEDESLIARGGKMKLNKLLPGTRIASS